MRLPLILVIALYVLQPSISIGKDAPELQPIPSFLVEGSQGSALKAFEHLSLNNQHYNVSEPGTELMPIAVEDDYLGYRHVRFALSFKGVPVSGSQIICHLDANDLVVWTSGRTPDLSGLNAIPKVSSADALLRALADTFEKPEKETPPKLVFVEQGKMTHLAWLVEIHEPDSFKVYDRYIDAHDGSIVRTTPRFFHAQSDEKRAEYPVSGNGQGQQQEYLDLVDCTLVVENSENQFLLQDLSRPGFTGSGNNETWAVNDAGAIYRLYDDDNHWGNDYDPDYILHRGAIDAHVTTSMVFDWLDDGIFWNSPINSFDNQGSEMTVFVNQVGGSNNAFWNGEDGAISIYPSDPAGTPTFSVSPDVISHEWGHAITGRLCGGLVYAGESGALDESFSDMMAMAFDYWRAEKYPDLGSFDWIWGDELSNDDDKRSMIDPHSSGQPQPDYYFDQEYWVETSCNPDIDNDYCGVHTNSGVPNKWFNLLAAGGDHYGVSVAGLEGFQGKSGVVNASNVARYANQWVWSPSATLPSAAQGGVQAAMALGGQDWADQALLAWQAVGVMTFEMAPPVLVQPAPGAEFSNPASVQLNWTQVAGATSYEVVVDSPNLTNPMVFHPTGTTQPVTGLAAGTYSWQVAPSRENQPLGPMSAAWSFTVLEPAPVIIAPGFDEGFVYPSDITLEWDSLPGVTGYILEWDNESDFASPTTANISISNHILTGLPIDVYYWRVRGVFANGQGSWANSRFSLQLEAPEVVLPDDGQPFSYSGESVLLDWEAVTGATQYELQWGTSPNLASPSTISLTSTSYTLPGLSAETYYWRVRGMDGTNQGAWSTTRSFYLFLSEPMSDPPVCREVGIDTAYLHEAGLESHGRNLAINNGMAYRVEMEGAGNTKLLYVNSWSIVDPSEPIFFGRYLAGTVDLGFDLAYFNSPTIVYGDKIYCTGGSARVLSHNFVVTIDVSIPNQPMFEDIEFLGAHAGDVYDATVRWDAVDSQAYLYVAYNVWGQIDSYCEVACLSLADQSDPAPIWTMEMNGTPRVLECGPTSLHILESFWDGNQQDYSLSTYDYSNPPNHLGSSALSGDPSDLAINPSGDRLYVAAGLQGIHVFDISSLGQPTVLNSISLPHEARRLLPRDGYLVSVGNSTLDVVSYSGEFQNYSSFENQPLNLNQKPFLAVVSDKVVYDNGTQYHVFSHGLNLGLYDSGIFSSPSVSVDFMGPYLVAVNGWGAELNVFDNTDPSAPVHVGMYVSTSQIALWDVEIEGHFAYVIVNDEPGLEIFDLRYPTAPRKVVAWQTPQTTFGIQKLCVENGYVYCIGTHGFNIIDVMDPERPAEKGSISGTSWNFSRFGSDLAVAGNYVFITHNHELRIVDVSNPSSPTLVTGSAWDGLEASVVLVHKNLVYLRGINSLSVYDISDPMSPVLVGETSLPGYSSNEMSLYWPHLYLACSDHIAVVDISTPANPMQVDRVEAPEGVSLTSVDAQTALYAEGVSGYISLIADVFKAVSVCNVPVIVDGSENFSSIYNPTTSKSFWQFSWLTEGYSDPGLDFVVVTDGPRQSKLCEIGEIRLEGWTQGGEMSTVVEQPDGRFLHTMTRLWDCQSGCYFRSVMGSGGPGGVVTSDNQTSLQVRECLGLGGGLKMDVPKRAFFESAAPNPFNPEIEFNFYIPTNRESASLTIYDIKGRAVRDYEASTILDGWNNVIWMGTDDNEHKVSSGVYFVRLSVDGVSQTKKIAMLK